MLETKPVQNHVMEERISAAIVRRFFEKLERHLAVDAAIVGAGPSGLVAARELARDGWRVAIFESALAPGGGVWGGGMLLNEVVVQSDALPILADFGIAAQAVGDDYHVCDAVELASGLIFGARRAGAVIFNAVKVEDIVVRDGRVNGVVVNWTPVARLQMHVDPLVIMARAVVDGTGHPSEVAAMAARKAGLLLDSPNGAILGEKPMWMERGEVSTVENTKRLYPGLYASGMAANNVQGGFRMGPIFGGMLKSGRKLAAIIANDLRAENAA
jgi:thiamine thiazole synthase